MPRRSRRVRHGAAGGKRRGRMLRRHYSRQHGVMAALDARHVHKAGIAANQRAAGKTQPRHRLVAALGDRARSIGQSLAAGERVTQKRMRFNALEFLERRKIRIRIIEVQDKPDRHQIVIKMINE